MLRVPNFLRRLEFQLALAFIALVLLALLYKSIMRLIPTITENCTRQCEELDLKGRMVPIYPEHMTRASRSKGPMECRCGD